MRQYISDVMPDAKGFLEIDGRGFKHICNVLRAKIGDVVAVRFPDGALHEMAVSKIDVKKKIVVMRKNKNPDAGAAVTENAENANAASALEMWLFMFVAKPQKMELVVRQATECGVKKIVPVIGEYSQAGNVSACESRCDTERFSRIIKEAREQSGSATATQIELPVSVNDAARMWKDAVSANGIGDSRAIVLYEKTDSTVPIYEAASNGDVNLAAVAVGCEGGISAGEIEILSAAGFMPVHFSTNILRCETAALYGIAALQTVIIEGSYDIRKS